MRGYRGPEYVIKKGRFWQVAEERWKDAECLHRSGRFDGAVYLCGYVLECFLKYAVCVRRGQAGLTEREAKSLGHNLAELLDTAGFRGILYEGKRQDLLLAFDRLNNRWSTELRYQPRSADFRFSRGFLNDTGALRNWLQQQLNA